MIITRQQKIIIMNNLDSFRNNNRFLMPALDHRGSFERMLGASSENMTREEKAVWVKKMVIQVTYDRASGYLLDPGVGLKSYRQFIAENNPPIIKPYLLCIEKSGYRDEDFERITELDYSVADLKNMGAKGVKILLYFHPFVKSTPKQLEIAKRVLSDCQRENLPFFLEFLTYEIKGLENEIAALIFKSLKMFLENKIVPDVFKLEYPGNGAACKNITKILGKTPWILLTKAGEYKDFRLNLEIAIKNGASGFLAGRSLWKDFIDYPKDEWPEFFRETVRKRFGEIVSLVL